MPYTDKTVGDDITRIRKNSNFPPLKILFLIFIRIKDFYFTFFWTRMEPKGIGQDGADNPLITC